MNEQTCRSKQLFRLSILGEVLEIIKTMAEELQKKCATPAENTTTVIPPEVTALGENCQNIDAMKILPNDDMETARKKHGEK